MRYFFVFLTIAAIWVGVLMIAIVAPTNGLELYATGVVLTFLIFLIGFYRK